MSIEIRVVTNGDDAFVAWAIDKRIDELRGFALIRRRNGTEEVVSTWVGFEGSSAPEGERRPSTEWPIQKFQWVDYVVTPGDVVAYRVVPMTGKAGSLTREEHHSSGWTDEIEIGPRLAKNVEVYFNRGIVASQWLSRRLGPATLALTAKSKKLTSIIGTPGDPIRDFLGGALKARLLELLEEARVEKRHVYAALYELDDPEIIEALLKLKKRAHVVLANGSVKKKGEDQNDEARAALEGVVDLHDRMVAPTALGHNKFIVFTSPAKEPLAVWTGSTNLTKTGLCTQSNNAVFLHSAALAKQFRDQWDLLKHSGDAFPQELVDANSEAKKSVALGGGKANVWFTRTDESQDLDEARAIVNGATKAILFLMFNPGPAGSLLNAIVERASPQSQSYAPNLYVHGALNQDPSTTKTPVTLFHRGVYDAEGYDVVLPAAIDERLAFWIPELLKKYQAHAMVHSKVIVVDPFSPDAAVITGSHNLGPKASQKNDENLVIFRRCPEVAQAYASAIMSVYNQYRWRFYRKRSAEASEYAGLKDDDAWQDPYLKRPERVQEIQFWMGR